MDDLTQRMTGKGEISSVVYFPSHRLTVVRLTPSAAVPGVPGLGVSRIGGPAGPLPGVRTVLPRARLTGTPTSLHARSRLKGAGSNTQRSEVDRDSTTEGEVDHQHHGERHCSEERPGIHEVGPFHCQGRHAYRGRQQ